LPYMSAIIMTQGYIPNFLTPTPMSTRGNIEDDFTELLATPDHLIQDDLLTLIEEDGDSDIRRSFVAYPREGMWRLVEELRTYWQRTLAQHWSRMMSTIEGDVLYRGRLLALEGPASLFADLHPSITYVPGKLHIQKRTAAHEPTDIQLEGSGIQLVPTIFQRGEPMIQIVPHWHPMLAFGARGAGLWYQKPITKSLELALGRGRARVLQTLTIPSTTGEVAYQMKISSATASQHLSRLTQAGLAVPRRSGKRVYYQLTGQGTELIALFERMG
jgi:DNA-binding transcriptional ArsR family regulator